MLKDIYDSKKTLSLYQPTQEVQEITKYAQESFSTGHEILNRAWPELNDMSVIDRDNKDKRIFNAFVDESCDDPSESWKFRTTRSMARNKALAMHAYLTAGFMFPMVSAQEGDNDEDKGVSDFMRDLMIWMGDNSNYKSSFLQLTMGMLTSPVTYFGAEYAEVMQKIKVKLDDGYETKEVLDEELSGFRAPVYGASEVLITNAYVQNIQQQGCVIKQRWLDYSDAKKKYGKHSNWDFVKKGVNSVFSEEDGLFYDVFDPDNSNSVSETICMWRSDDTEITYLGGIYMGDENTEWNPMKHRDNFDCPKYDVIPFGYNRISEHFFYYKSLINSLSWDDQLIDAMYENVMNGEFMFRNPPTVISGDDKIGTDVMFPGATIVSARENVKVQSLLPVRQDNSYQAIQLIEKSMEDASLSPTKSGQLPQASQKAFSVAKANQAADTLLNGVAQSFGESIIQYGRLMVNIAIRHLSVPQIEDISGTVKKLKYRQFILPKQINKGKNITKILRYDGNMVGVGMTKEQKDIKSLKLYKEAGEDKSIIVINPELAARMKYLIRIDPEEMFAQNKEYMQNLLVQTYTMLRSDPLVNADILLRKLTYSLFRGEGDELIKEKSEIDELMKAQMAGGQNPETKEIKPVAENPVAVPSF